MSILLTGATGFIGSHLLEKLVELNEKVYILIKPNSNTWRIDHIINSPSVVVVPSNQLSLVESIFEYGDVKAIFHLSTKYLKQNGWKDIDEMVYSNITFPVQLLELAIQYKVKYFINTGTWFEYAIQPKIDEEMAKVPFNFYANTKSIFEDLLIGEFNKGNIQGLTLTLFNPYGPRDNDFKIIPSIIRWALGNEPVSLKSDGESCYGFTYVSDIINAYQRVLYMINNKCFINRYENYFISLPFGFNIKTVVGILEMRLNRKIDLTFGNETDPKFVETIDISKARTDLCWEPKITLKSGLDMTLRYYEGFLK